MRHAIFLANGNAGDGAAGIAGSYWTIMGQGIAAALAERGHRLDVLNIASAADQAVLFPMLTRGPLPDALIVFNMLPHISAGADGASGLIGRLPCRVICLFLDHPIHLAPVLREQAALIAAQPALGRQRWFGVMESGHIPCLDQLGIDRDRVFVMAQAAAAVAAAPAPLGERPIPFLFAGTLGPMSGDDAFAAALGLADPRDQAKLAAAVAETIDGTRDVFDIVRDHFAEAADAGRTNDLYALAAAIDKRARLARRRRLLLSLRDLPLHLCGDVDPALLAELPRAVARGRLSFAATIELARGARAVINDTINLRDGALIRFFYAAGQGCLMASERNRFLDEAFPPGRAMLALDGRARDNGHALRMVMTDPAALQPVADEGRARVARAHTWSQRIDGLVAALEA